MIHLQKTSWWRDVHWLLAMNLVATVLAVIAVIASVCFREPDIVNTVTQQEIIRPKEHHNTTMTVTAYTPLTGINATVKKVRVGSDVAVSRDRIDLLGKKVYVSCEDIPVGVRQVTDLMAEDRSNHLDILVPDSDTAKKFGSKLCKVIELED